MLKQCLFLKNHSLDQIVLKIISPTVQIFIVSMIFIKWHYLHHPHLHKENLLKYMYLLIFYEIRALTFDSYNNSYLFTIKSLKVNAIVGSHRCSFHEDEIAANDVKEIKTSNEFKRLVMPSLWAFKKEKRKMFLIVTHLYIVTLLCILLSNLSGSHFNVLNNFLMF